MAEKIVVGLSGGIDSAAGALKLKKLGFEVHGLYIIMHDGFEESLNRAENAAQEAGIEFEAIDGRDVFKREVIDTFIGEYLKGRTPNPCVDCNSRVKIKLLCDAAKSRGIGRVATGHYAKIGKQAESGRYTVYCARDESKDQSYMLWQLTQEQLSMLETPLSDSLKGEIKSSSAGVLKAAEYRESQEICFIPDNDYAAFIKNNVSADKLSPEGDFIDQNGKVLGKHKGIHNYTIGQRRFLGISLGQRAFVTAINPIDNTVTLGFSGSEYTDSFTVDSLNILASEIPAENLTVKTRYHAEKAPVAVEFREGKLVCKSEKPLRAVTPGQSAVFYLGDMVVCGGKII